MWYDNKVATLASFIRGGNMSPEAALTKIAEFVLEFGNAETLNEWIANLEHISNYDASLARKVQKNSVVHPACEDALRQLQEKYPAEVKKFFDHLLAELVLRENRAVLRGEGIEV